MTKSLKYSAHKRLSIIDQYLLELLCKVFEDLCKKFKLEPPHITLNMSYGDDSYGHYDYDAREIQIRLKSGQERLNSPYYSIEFILDTLVHEVAHAKTHQSVGADHDPHGETWQHWFAEMASYVRKELL